MTAPAAPARRAPADPRARLALFALASVAAAALVLAAKLAWLGPFVAAGAPARFAAFGAFVALVLVARARLRVGPEAAALFAAPLAALLFVNLALTPMMFEAVHLAERLPRPEGVSLVEARPLRPFEANHPRVDVSLRDEEARGTLALTRDTRDAFAGAGWNVTTYVEPGGRVGGAVADYGLVVAKRWGFTASCAVAARDAASLRCTLSV